MINTRTSIRAHSKEGTGNSNLPLTSLALAVATNLMPKATASPILTSTTNTTTRKGPIPKKTNRKKSITKTYPRRPQLL